MKTVLVPTLRHPLTCSHARAMQVSSKDSSGTDPCSTWNASREQWNKTQAILIGRIWGFAIFARDIQRNDRVALNNWLDNICGSCWNLKPPFQQEVLGFSRRIECLWSMGMRHFCLVKVVPRNCAWWLNWVVAMVSSLSLQASVDCLSIWKIKIMIYEPHSRLHYMDMYLDIWIIYIPDVA